MIFTNFQDIPGNIKFRYRIKTKIFLDFESIVLDIYSSGLLEIPGKF